MKEITADTFTKEMAGARGVATVDVLTPRRETALANTPMIRSVPTLPFRRGGRELARSAGTSREPAPRAKIQQILNQ